jgi:hypothetical protein
MPRARLEFPERLVDTDSRASAIIQHALAEPESRAGEQQSWQRLQERSRRSRARWVWPVIAAFGISCAALAGAWHEPSSYTELKAEVWQPRPAIAPSSREHGAQLLVLRAELLTARGDCAGALEAAQKARDAGAILSRLETIVRRCRPATPTASTAPPL